MVKLSVVDENDQQQKKAEAGFGHESDSDFSDESEEFEDEFEQDDEYDDEFDPSQETLLERLAALKDAIPPSHRTAIASTLSKIGSIFKTSFTGGGKFIYVVTSSALLLGVPLSLSILSEQQLIEMEKEMKLTQGTNDVLTGQTPAANA